MPEINSVAGQLVGIPVGQVYTAGPGIKIDNVNKTVRTDETVLWSGSIALTSMNGSGSAIQMSESLYNFEMIVVYGKPLSTHNAVKIVEFVPNSNEEGFDFMSYFKGGGTGTGGALRFGFAFIQYNSTSMWCKSNEMTQASISSGGVAMATNQSIITKIVGINRIQSA